MAREIILDTETTGLDPKTGHRLIEIACIELEDFVPTGRTFHRRVHPGRSPRFDHEDVVDAFLDFVGDMPLVAHNAAFDRGFVNFELELCGRIALPDHRWIDTLDMAKKRYPGMYNSLDALCKRFKISLADREKHGALIDCRLLAEVYLELCGGKERALDLTPAEVRTAVSLATGSTAYGVRPRPLAMRSTAEERAAHDAFIASTLKDKAVWLKA